MAKAVYAGSFDPFTRGHLEVLAHASDLFDEVCIVIAQNPSKHRAFPADRMLIAIEKMLHNYHAVLPNCTVALLPEGMAVVDFAKAIGAAFLVRGVRSVDDCAYELKMAEINKQLDVTIQTIYIPTNSNTSSTMVRNCKQFGRRWSVLVPTAIFEEFDDGQD